jgi:hypothetical protein
VNIVPVESGRFLSREEIRNFRPEATLLEHDPQSEPLELPSPDNVVSIHEAPRDEALLTELSNSIAALAQRVGVSLDDK